MTRDRSHRPSRTHGSTPYDADAELGVDEPIDPAADITQQFWGATRNWVPRRPADRSRSATDDTTGSLRALRGSLSGRRPPSSDRPRQHGHRSGDMVDDVLGDAFDDDFDVFGDELDAFDDDFGDDAVEVPLTPAGQVGPLAERLGVGAVDPLLLRLGVLVLIGLLLAPLALALRSGDDSGSLATAPVAHGLVPELASVVPAAGGDPAPAGEPEVIQADPTATDPAPTQEAATEQAPPDDTVPAATQPQQTESADTQAGGGQSAPETTLASTEPAVVAVEAERVVPACPQRYEANPGDSWYRIAEAAGISPGELLRENGASLDTVILPGDSICLPAGATVPAPPAPPTTAAPATTVAAPPSTTKPPTTTVPLSRSEVEQIIRDVWPDELEERALEIAWRESKYRPAAYNGWCCYGLFQIHWGAHQSWLDDLGIHTTDDLRDARKNTEAAYAIYQRAGGWGPWGG